MKVVEELFFDFNCGTKSSRTYHLHQLKNFCFTAFKKLKTKKKMILVADAAVSMVSRKTSVQKQLALKVEIQIKISNACDNGDYAALASLDLTADFDVADRKLLENCLKIMKIPSQ